MLSNKVSAIGAGMRALGVASFLMTVLIGGCASISPRPAANDCYNPAFVFTVPAEAAAACETARANRSATVEQVTNANFNLGRAQLEMQKYAEAVEPLRRTLLLDPGRQDARLRLAQANMGLQKYDDAISYLASIPRESSEYLDALFVRANAYEQRHAAGDVELALRDLQAARERAAADPKKTAELARANARLEAVAMTLGLEQQAVQSPEALMRAKAAFETAVKVNPGNARAYSGLGETSLRLAGMSGTPAGERAFLEQSRNAFLEAIRLGEATPLTHAGVAHALLALDRPEEAILHLEQAVQLEGNFERHRELAGAYKLLADNLVAGENAAQARQALEQAARNYEAALTLDPRSAQTLIDLAAVQWNPDRPQMDLDQPGKAHANLLKAVALAPSLPAPYLALGRQAFAAVPRDIKLAGDYFRNALALSRNTDKTIRAEASYYLSRLATEGGAFNRKEAIEGADYALSLDAANDMYRQQACLARIRGGEVRNATARSLCLDDSRALTPGASVLEGMYYLRRAQFAAGGDRKRDLEDAYRAFSAGLLASAQTGGEPELKARLEVGQGIAHYCVGFASLGQETINSAGELRDRARVYFDQYRVAKCENY